MSDHAIVGIVGRDEHGDLVEREHCEVGIDADLTLLAVPDGVVVVVGSIAPEEIDDLATLLEEQGWSDLRDQGSVGTTAEMTSRRWRRWRAGVQ